ncbi:antibiotic biosynthesis monooxygenase family protein [Paracoccus onubensis]|uniref:Antibiotic biosynthesis monooxygenase n=1 Tax=Paracoccus onubensis TaxID=1675788 RepID=A0A418SN08_9RHOB|nr:antibiotic biosynthesis monooxygenase [Paracoccus onubensis]RJE82277.1 antibiotic biosynthesis monooxygenase [Paracoccus onubensis]
MPITVFRSRVNEETRPAYVETGKKMAEIGQKMPGFVSFKQFHATDGEHVTIVEFDTDEHQQAWANHPEHLEARRHGREAWFDEYDIAVCEVIRRYKKP